MQRQDRRTFSKVWLAYFYLSIGFFGLWTAALTAWPLFYLGRLWQPAERLGGWFLQLGVKSLLGAQPWFKADIELKLPHRTPETPYLTCSNHRSHLDMFLLLREIPNIRVIGKASLFSVPFIGVFLKAMRDVPVTQDLQSYLDGIEELYTGTLRGEATHIFPEMTRCSPGTEGTQRFHLQFFHLALKKQIPILPIAIVDTDATWPKGTSGLAYRRPIVVRTLSPIDPKNFATAKEFCQAVQSAINESLATEKARLNDRLRTHEDPHGHLHPHIQQ